MKPAVDTDSVPTGSGSNEAVTGIRSTGDGKLVDQTQVTDTPTEEIELEAIEAAELSAKAIPEEAPATPPAATAAAVEEPRRRNTPPPLPAAALRARLPGARTSAPAPSLGLSPLGQLLPPAVQRDPSLRPSYRTPVAIVGSEEALAELERVTKRMRERDAYLAELEQVYAQRSEALLKAELELDKLRAELEAQTERVAELERQLSARAPQPRASQPPPAAQQRPSQPPGPRSSHDLTLIRGIGPGYARALYAMGVSSFAHIAAWTPEDIANYGKKLKTPQGRIERDRWVDQARALLADKS